MPSASAADRARLGSALTATDLQVLRVEILDAHARLVALLQGLEAILRRSETEGSVWPWEELAVRFVAAERLEVAVTTAGGIEPLWLGAQLMRGYAELKALVDHLVLAVDARRAALDG